MHTSEVQDTHIDLATPENIAFHYRVAGPFRRLPAYLIDTVIRVLLMAGVALLIGWLVLGTSAFGASPVAGMGIGFMLVIWFAIDWFYGAVFEAVWNGQTPGKRLMQIRVLGSSGQPISGSQAVLRNFLRVVDAVPMTLFMVGFIAAATNRRFQRLGDLAAGTMVVVEEPQRLYGVVRIEEPQALQLAQELPVGFVPSRQLARALSDYVLRRKALGWNRREEVARHLGEPLKDRFNLPVDTSNDLLLCALYHRTFLSDRDDDRFDEGITFTAEQPVRGEVAAFR